MPDNTIISFEPTENVQTNTLDEMQSYIKIIGVGGGGCNAVQHMYNRGITGVEFIVCNTDKKSLMNNPVPKQIQLGNLGAGNNPERAKKAALAQKDEIKSILQQNTRMLFITAGMGGGTGTGVAPVIAEIAKSITVENDDDIEKILVVAVVTFPFQFEGPKRLRQAEAGIAELRKHVDSILIINNEKLRDFGNETLSEAFMRANDVLLTAAKGIAEIITVSARIAIDFQDVNTVMQNSGTALMGIGRASGPNRAEEAIKMAAESPLLNDNNIAGAKNILLFFSYSPEHEIKMDELSIVTETITELTGDRDTDVIWGEGSDNSLQDELVVTLIATGFDKKQPERETPTPIIPPTIPSGPDNTPSAPKQPQPYGDPNDAKNRNGDPITHHPTDRSPDLPSSEFDEITIINKTDEHDNHTSTPTVEGNTSENGGRIIIFEDDKDTEKNQLNIPETHTSEILTPVEDDGYTIIKATTPVHPEPIINETKQTPSKNIEVMALSRAERMKRLWGQLKADPNLIDEIENTPATELLGMESPFQDNQISETKHTSIINSEGKLVENKYVNQEID